MTAARAGFALVFSMLLVLALTVLAAGVLAVGTREAWVAGAVARKARTDRAAERVVLDAVAGWSTRAMADLPVGATRAIASGRSDATVRVDRVDSALFRVRGRVTEPGPDGETRSAAALLIRAVLPPRVAGAFPAALSADGPVRVLGGRVAATDSACGVPVPGVFAADVSVATGTLVVGEPPVLRENPPPPPAPDPLAPGLASEIATLRVPGRTAVPRPLALDGECVADGDNWGSPDPASPCYDLQPVVLAGDLRVTGGVGRGVLVVDGDLQVDGEFHFEGVLVVRGHLELAGGTVRGGVRAQSATVTDGTIEWDACTVDAAVSAPGLDRAFRPPVRWWLPTF